MNPIFVRPARQDEKKMLLDWSLENPGNGFDPEVPMYPTTVTWCGFDKDGQVAFLPVQLAYVMESFAPRPGLSPRRQAEALKEFTQNLITQAHLNGVRELYFLGSNPETNEYAENYIFEEVPYKVYRAKLRNLEGN